jgi:hypothetical protein
VGSGGAAGSGGAPGSGGAATTEGTAGTSPAGGGGTAGSDAGANAFDPDADAPVTPPPVIHCDVDCPGGPCAARAGTPTVIATSASPAHVGAIAVGAGALYYGTIAKDARAGGQLRKVTLATGVDSLLVAGVQVEQIRLDPQGSVYYLVDTIQSTEERLFTIDASGMPELAAQNDYAIPAFVPIPDNLLLAKSYPGGGTISQPDQLIEDLTEPLFGLAVDERGTGSVFYWTSGAGPGHLSRVTELEVSGGAPGTVLTTAADTLAGPILDGANLYFIHLHAPGDCQGSVMVVPSSGGVPALVSAGNSGSDVSSFAVDEGDSGFVYWTTPDAGGLVFRAAKGGAMPEVIASAQPGARAVAVDATRVYWIAAGPHGDEVRAIMK